MSKVELSKPVLICFYGYPGSGKSYVSRNLSTSLQIANLNGDRIRNELFQTPRFDPQENSIIQHLMNYMCEEFLSAGVSVVYDAPVLRVAQRRTIRELAKKHRADFLLVWLQIDQETAYYRTQNRDRRTFDDRHSQNHTEASFQQLIRGAQNPQPNEDYLVVSGKHSYTTQKNAIVNRLYQMGLITSDNVQSNVTKPELVNLVPNPHQGRVDLSRRNITIR